MVVGFKVKVNSLNRESSTVLGRLFKGDDSKIVALFSQLIRVHIPQVVTLPDGVDYYDDIQRTDVL